MIPVMVTSVHREVSPLDNSSWLFEKFGSRYRLLWESDDILQSVSAATRTTSDRYDLGVFGKHTACLPSLGADLLFRDHLLTWPNQPGF